MPFGRVGRIEDGNTHLGGHQRKSWHCVVNFSIVVRVFPDLSETVIRFR